MAELKKGKLNLGTSSRERECGPSCPSKLLLFQSSCVIHAVLSTMHGATSDKPVDRILTQQQLLVAALRKNVPRTSLLPKRHTSWNREPRYSCIAPTFDHSYASNTISLLIFTKKQSIPATLEFLTRTEEHNH